MRVATVRAFPRLHVGLVDLAGATRRRFGGAGFMITGCETLVEARPARQDGTHGHREDRAAEDLREALGRLRRLVFVPPVQITVREAPPGHVGLGSKTTLVLSALTAALSASGIPLDRAMIQTASGRGGASGVGVHAFFGGGFTVDSGHEGAHGAPLLPSGATRPASIPLLVTRYPIPDEWRFVLALPYECEVFSAAREVQFFRDNTPTEKSESLRNLASLYHGVLPAVQLSDLGLLRESLAELHECGFKAREVAAQPACVKQAFELLSGLSGVAVGLSSLGPLVYAVCSESAVTQVSAALDSIPSMRVLAVGAPRNSGFEVQVQ